MHVVTYIFFICKIEFLYLFGRNEIIGNIGTGVIGKNLIVDRGAYQA